MRSNVYNLNRLAGKAAKDAGLGSRIKELITLSNDLRTASIAVSRLISGIPGMQEGTSTTTKSRMNAAIRFRMNGQDYYAPAAEAVLDSAGNDITATKFGAWRFQISAAGALTSTAADATGDMAFESIDTALLEIANKALVANTIVVGYLVIEAAAGGFTIGTDLPVTSDAQVTAATYYDELGDSGVVTPLSVLTISATPEELSIGTATVKRNGVQLAEIASDTTFPFPVADTITTLLYGGWLVVSNNAGTAVTLVSADGKSEAALMAYATYVAVDAALDSLETRMPGRFVVLGRVIIKNGVKAPWTAITDDIANGVDVVETRYNKAIALSGIQRVSASAVVDITGVSGE